MKLSCFKQNTIYTPLLSQRGPAHYLNYNSFQIKEYCSEMEPGSVALNNFSSPSVFLTLFRTEILKIIQKSAGVSRNSHVNEKDDNIYFAVIGKMSPICVRLIN